MCCYVKKKKLSVLLEYIEPPPLHSTHTHTQTSPPPHPPSSPTPTTSLPLPQNDGSIEEWQHWGNRERFRIYIVLWHAHINTPPPPLPPNDKETTCWQGHQSLFGCLQVKRFAISPPSFPLFLSISLSFSRFHCKAYNLCELFSLLTSAGI